MKWIDTLVQLRKEKVDSIEKDLMNLQSMQTSAQATLSRYIQDFNEIVMPQASNGAMLQQLTMQRGFATAAIKEQKEQLRVIDEKLEAMQNVLLEANKELEQAKYIKADYVKKELYKAKQKEQKRLDELASQRFYLTHRQGHSDV